MSGSRTEVFNENGMTVVNTTEVESTEVMEALSEQHPEVASLVQWSRSATSTGKSRKGSLVDRDFYLPPENFYEQIKAAYYAAEHDDVVSGVVEGTESLAFGKLTIDTEDQDQTSIWNQIREDIELDQRMREMWRELLITSQVYVATWYGRKTYKVSGRTRQGVKRKRTFSNMQVPLGMTILDPFKVVPVGNHMLFNKDQLCYAADQGEYDTITAVLNGDKSDPMVESMFLRPYTPDTVERRLLAEDGLQTSRLFLMNPANTFRHTETRSQYQRFATVRLLSVFELLDLKAQLRAMDRAFLLGGSSFITVVTVGGKDGREKNAAISRMASQVKTLARVPVLVGDENLSVEIVTPKIDNTLKPDRYNGIDSRITSRLYQLFASGSYSSGSGRDDSIKLAKMVARGLESRRQQLKRSVEKHVLMPTYRMNEDVFDEKPVIRFHPKRIALDFDPVYANFILDLLDRGHISRESGLEEVDYDQDVELRRRRAEREFDDEFTPRHAPGSNLPAGDDGGAAGRTAGRNLGGNRHGGGAGAGGADGHGQEPVDPTDLSDDR